MKRQLLLLLAFIVSMTMFAGPVSQDDALAKAQAFVGMKRPAQSGGQHRVQLAYQQMSLAQTAQDALYYVFNIGNEDGFVIISGDDGTPDVLGYVDKGTFDYERLPDNARELLAYYAAQIRAIQEGGGVASTYRAPRRAALSPMLTCTWDQVAPFNSECPQFFTYGQSVTGCVATALAQILYYHRANGVPVLQNEITDYDCKRNWSGLGKIHVDAIPAGSPIDWDNMIDSYKGSYTQEQKQAVANLMKYCGAGVRMDYANNANGGSSASGAMAAVAAKAYFGFRNDAHDVAHADMTDEEWEQTIYGELQAGRPVLLSGQTSGNQGHAFVCDGYDGSGKYHINWGWGGYCDGFFLLSYLNAGGAGTGGANGTYAYDQHALVNMEPGDGTPYDDRIRTTTSHNYLYFDQATLSTEPVTQDRFSWGGTQFHYYITVHNYTTSTHDFQCGMGVFKGDDLLDVQQVRNMNNFTNDVFYNFYGYFFVGGGLENGTYRILPVSREASSDEWLPDDGTDEHYYSAVVTDTQITYYVGEPSGDDPTPDPDPDPEPDPVYVTVKDCSRAYGDGNPAFEVEVTGGTLEGTPEITCDATETSPVGTYDITISMGSVSNDNVTLTGGKLTIVQAPLTATARSYSRKQGEENPVFEIDYDGFKNGETEDVLTEKPTASTEATPASAPGDYAVVLSGGEAQNYALTLVDGVLTVIEADPIVVTALSYTRNYGEENPEFEYVVEGGTLDGMPEISCEATKDSDAGFYDIVVSRGSVTNPNVTFINGTLIVEKVFQILTWAQELTEIEQYSQVELTAKASSGLVVSYYVDDESVCKVVTVGDDSYLDCFGLGETLMYAIQLGGTNWWESEKIFKLVRIVNTSGIDHLTSTPTSEAGDVYDLSGRKVMPKLPNSYTPTLLRKGIYIVNGKKIIVK